MQKWKLLGGAGAVSLKVRSHVVPYAQVAEGDLSVKWRIGAAGEMWGHG